MNMIFVRALLLGLGALLPAACSSSGSSSTSSTGSGNPAATCDTFCTTILGAKCANDTAETCATECTTALADAGDCADELAGFYDCALGLDFACSADGTAELADPSQLFGECPAEYSGVAKCSACQANADDTACDTCQKTQCCAEFQAVYGDADFIPYLQCVTACMDQACQTACQDAHPSVLQKQVAASACVQNTCADACNN